MAPDDGSRPGPTAPARTLRDVRVRRGDRRVQGQHGGCGRFSPSFSSSCSSCSSGVGYLLWNSSRVTGGALGRHQSRQDGLGALDLRLGSGRRTSSCPHRPPSPPGRTARSGPTRQQAGCCLQPERHVRSHSSEQRSTVVFPGCHRQCDREGAHLGAGPGAKSKPKPTV